MFVLATQAPPEGSTASPTATPPSPLLRLMLQPPTGQRYSRECEKYVVVSRLNVYDVAYRSGLGLPLGTCDFFRFGEKSPLISFNTIREQKIAKIG